MVLRTVKNIALISLLATLLFAQEQILTVLPNVQLTVFLILLYSKKIGFVRTTVIVAIHVVLDNLVMGSFNVIYTPAMFLGWMIIPLVVCSVGKNINSNIALAFLGILFSLTYSWCFIIPTSLMTGIDAVTYLLSDILFEIIMALSSFLTILLLYNPISKAFDVIIKRDDF